MCLTFYRLPTRMVGFVLLAHLASCGGNKVLTHEEPLAPGRPLAEAQDDRIAIFLDWVIVAGGPGSWAKNASWDEYLLRVENDSNVPLTVMSVLAYDSKMTPNEPQGDRALLVKASKKNAKRYEAEGVKVKAGVGAEALLLAGGAAATAAPAIGIGALYYGSTAAAGTAVTALATAPVFLLGGVVVAVNNSKVNREIGRRQTVLPINVEAGQSQKLDLFFPLVPSPRKVEVNYLSEGMGHQAVIDVSKTLEGLHLAR